MTEFKSIQELLNILCSCVAIDDNGNTYIRTNSSSVTPDPGPSPDPTISFTNVGDQNENTSRIYKEYLNKANLIGIHCQSRDDDSGSFFTELPSNQTLTINFSDTATKNLFMADVAVKNDGGNIYLQTPDTLKWMPPSTFQIKCGHLLAIKGTKQGNYNSPYYVAPQITVGDQKDNGYGYLIGKLFGLIPGITEHYEEIYYNLFNGMFINSPRLSTVDIYYPHILGQNIYKSMFANCPLLNTANLFIVSKPLITRDCIGFAESIFDGCSNLRTLNASISCSEITAARMFANAFNNTQITELNISNVKSISGEYKVGDLNYPLHNWLGGASKRVGTITKDRALSLTENSESGIPTNWNVVNV